MLASVVKFSPTPEYQDAISVGLLLHETPPRMVWDAKFPKLACVAPDLNSHLFQTWLSGLNQMLQNVSPSDARSALKRWSGQLSFGPEFPIAEKAQSDVIDRLLSLVTGKSKTRYAAGEVLGGSRFEHVLDDSLASFGVSQASLRRRPLLSDYLSPDLRREVGTLKTRVSRVVDSQRDLILIDGVDFRLGDRQRNQQRAEKIGFTYFAVNRARQGLAAREHRELTRVSVLFVPSTKITVQEEYARHVLEKESDLLIDFRKADPSRDASFRHLLERADEPRLALH